MSHPSTAELLQADTALGPDARAHLAGCEDCARLRRLLRPAADAAAAEVGELPALTEVDRAAYVLHEELRDGTGGMGSTIRATDRRLGRAVAIKQPLADVEPGLARVLRQRFELEARLTARLEHPAIVTVYDAGRWPDGEPFYAMRLVRGAPLSRLIAGRSRLGDRLELVPEVVKVAEALAYAHAQGVLHRDVKPDNILVGPYGQTVLIDWGLAREHGGAVDDAAAAPSPAGDLTVLGVGTPHYMPPEQAGGAEPDERLDVYALGATLYHVVAGAPPYPGDAAAARAALLARGPRPLGERVIAAPPSLVACIERAMARDPAARFATMNDLVDELHRFLRGERLRSYRYGLLERIGRWASRHRPVLLVGGFALAVVIGVLVQSVRRIANERDARGQAQRRAEQALADSRARNATLLAQHTATRADAVLAALAAVAGQTEDDPAARPARQGLIDALAAGPLTRSLASGGELLVAGASDGRLVVAGMAGALRIYAATGELLDQYQLDTGRPRLVAARGGRALICGLDQHIALIDLDRRQVRSATAPSELFACALDRDGAPITGGAGEVIRWTAALQPDARIPLAAPAPVIVIAADGAVLFTSAGELWRWPGGAADRATRGHGHDAIAYGLLARADGTVVTAGFDGTVRRWAVDGGPPTVTAVIHAEPGELLGELHPIDDDHVALGGQSSPSVRMLIRDRGAGGGDGFRVGWRSVGMIVRDDVGRTLRVGDDALAQVDVDTGATLRTLGEVEAASLRAQVVGGAVLTWTRSGTITLWETEGDDVPRAHTAEVTALAIGPDGGLISAGLDGALVVHHPGRGPEVVIAGGAELLVARLATAAPRLVALDADGVAHVVELAAGGARRVVLGGPGPALDVAIAPDGARIAIAGADGVTVLPVDGGPAVVLPDAGAATAVLITGDAIYTGHLGGTVRRWTLTGRPAGAHTLAGVTPPTGVRALFVIGDALAVATRGRVDTVDRGTLAPRASWPRELIGTPTVDGRWLGVGDGGAALIATADAGAAPRPLTGHARVITAAARSPDDRWLATGDAGGVVLVRDLADGALLARIDPGGTAAVTALAFVGPALLAIGDVRGALRTIPLDLAGGVARACARLARIGRAAEAPTCR